ncbi:hypothetical protein [Anatilimnocola floriformis]|uniref:hypothetical protein n=1 Tax=Anatilimnocola floriformis TaxID=2948575 RepID=UPI0020C4FA9D|nr:hypothetical protein [Anatilimnocola floriformis]
MKRIFTIAAIVICSSLASYASAAEPARDRAADTSDVTAFLGLQDNQFQALSATEANEIRGTGGCYCHGGGGLLNLNLNANVKANLNVLGAVKVKAHVTANIRVR